MQKIIDCHCHIYPDKIAEKASESIGKFYSLPMAYHGTAAEMIREREAAGITHSVVFSVATKPSQVRSINSFIAEEVAAYPNLCGLGAAHPDSDDQDGDIRNIVDLGLKGVKLHPDFQGVGIDDPRCYRIYELCIKYDLILLLHMGDLRYDFSSPERLVRALEMFPGLKVIGAHFGGWGMWKKAEETLKGYKDFLVDCSSSFAFLPKEESLRIIRSYGSERVLFGTDYPMWDFKEELKRFNELGLTGTEKENILYNNANRLFFGEK